MNFSWQASLKVSQATAEKKLSASPWKKSREFSNYNTARVFTPLSKCII